MTELINLQKKAENMLCPSCNTKFDEVRDKAYHCPNCGWMIEIDGTWRPCPEPPKIKEPEKKPEPKPVEPEPEKIPDTKEKNNVRSYLGGLITITEKE